MSKTLAPGRKLSKNIRTSENWYPAKGGFVTVFFSKLISSPGYPMKWRVSVWGDDDFGLERDFVSRMEALESYKLIVDYTTQEALYAFGFNHA